MKTYPSMRRRDGSTHRERAPSPSTHDGGMNLDDRLSLSPTFPRTPLPKPYYGRFSPTFASASPNPYDGIGYPVSPTRRGRSIHNAQTPLAFDRDREDSSIDVFSDTSRSTYPENTPVAPFSLQSRPHEPLPRLRTPFRTPSPVSASGTMDSFEGLRRSIIAASDEDEIRRSRATHWKDRVRRTVAAADGENADILYVYRNSSKWIRTTSLARR